MIFSGHEVPGEGEHKVMDFIRAEKVRPGYNPNTRHCLYGLDADLIILGLLTHEPHFALLREEVQFGRKKTNTSAEKQSFFLLSLKLFREYLELEFSDITVKKVNKNNNKKKCVCVCVCVCVCEREKRIEERRGAVLDLFCQRACFLLQALPFKFDLERLIDDWVLLGFLVGNDFLPHIPNFHINEVRRKIK